MALGPGVRLGPYEIVSAIGAGGMGEVYRAHDAKLNRNVALKILPGLAATDPDRIARFHREAQVLASLNHPHIAAIYGFEDSGETHALVLELVDGPTLADRIAQGPIPVEEALPIARQITEALEAAHEQGIVHRDLKPANIKLTPNGAVKVLDFGLAKLNDPNVSNRPNAPNALSMSPTITSPALMTGLGVMLGTAAYMAPEQAKGRPADRRADIWAFGCVLFEMLTGRRAFDGEDVADVMVAVLSKEPDWSALPATTPAGVITTIKRCLQKDPRQRIHDAADVRLALEGAFSPPPVPADAGRQSHVARFWHRPAVMLPAALVTGGIAAAAGVWLVLRPAPQPVVRLNIAHPGTEVVGGTNVDVAISPDGARVAYLANENGESHLYVRSLGSLAPLRIANAGIITNVFVSPDNQWIGFLDNSANRTVKKVSVTGGAALTICSVPGGFGGVQGVSWGSDDTIVIGSTTSGLFRCSAGGGGTADALTKPDGTKGDGSHRNPEVLPGARAVLFTILGMDNRAENARIAALDLRTGAVKVIVQGGSSPHYAASGYLVYGSAGTLRAVHFDPDRLEVTGNSVPVVEGVVMKAAGTASFGIAGNGTLVYIAGGTETAKRTLVWVDRQGHEEPINVPVRAYAYATLSPDGTRIALDVREGTNDIWIWNVQRQTLTRLTFDPGLNRSPVWAPDGTHVAYSAARDGSENVYWQPSEGSGPPEPLTHESKPTLPNAFSPDGTRLVFNQPDNAPFDIGILMLQGERKATLVLNTPFSEVNAAVSPDGRWLAYQSNESGRDEVYVRPFPDVSAGRWQVSTNGGTRPVWSRNGRELFYYLPPGTLMAVPIQGGSTFVPGTPQQLFKGVYLSPQSGRQYDVSPDGKRFLMIKDARPSGEAPPPPQLVVVQNWFEELKRLLP